MRLKQPPRAWRMAWTMPPIPSWHPTFTHGAWEVQPFTVAAIYAESFRKRPNLSLEARVPRMSIGPPYERDRR
jgi:hypothetical protein